MVPSHHTTPAMASTQPPPTSSQPHAGPPPSHPPPPPPRPTLPIPAHMPAGFSARHGLESTPQQVPAGNFWETVMVNF